MFFCLFSKNCDVVLTFKYNAIGMLWTLFVLFKATSYWTQTSLNDKFFLQKLNFYDHELLRKCGWEIKIIPILQNLVCAMDKKSSLCCSFCSCSGRSAILCYLGYKHETCHIRCLSECPFQAADLLSNWPKLVFLGIGQNLCLLRNIFKENKTDKNLIRAEKKSLCIN